MLWLRDVSFAPFNSDKWTLQSWIGTEEFREVKKPLPNTLTSMSIFWSLFCACHLPMSCVMGVFVLVSLGVWVFFYWASVKWRMFSSFSQEWKLNLKLSLNLLAFVSSVPGKDQDFHREDLGQVLWVSLFVCLGQANERCLLRPGLYLCCVWLIVSCLCLLPSTGNEAVWFAVQASWSECAWCCP